MGKSISKCKNKEKDKSNIPKKTIKVRYMIFFDGTLNNKNNTLARINNTEEYKYLNKWYNQLEAVDSFKNDESNIAKIAKMINTDKTLNPDFDFVYKNYIEGIGTEDNKGDSLKGKTLGTGDTGIDGKVKKGINTFCENITLNIGKENNLEITIDCFGFSRGAAAARHFIYIALEDPKLKIKVKLNEYNIIKLEFNFVGLFETVAHYGLEFGKDDTNELHLDYIKKAKKVVHLIASDEYRKNFPLTNTKSKSDVIITLPGVHSDIGGGYNSSSDCEENKMVYENTKILKRNLKSNEIRNWFISEGWAYPSEIIINKIDNLILNRNGIKNTYPDIPLLIMINNSESATIKYNFSEKEEIINKINNDTYLNKMYKILTPLGNGNWEKFAFLKMLRRYYFHFSSDASASSGGVANYPNLNSNYNYERTIYDG